MARRTSSPPVPVPPDQPHGTRRISGSRREATERVRLVRRTPDPALVAEFEGWTLNISRGGARLVIEGCVDPDVEYLLYVGDVEGPRPVRIAWVQDEADGQILGCAFLDYDGTQSSPSSTGGVPPAPDSVRRSKA